MRSISLFLEKWVTYFVHDETVPVEIRKSMELAFVKARAEVQQLENKEDIEKHKTETVTNK
jgi:hypothetical protein